MFRINICPDSYNLAGYKAIFYLLDNKLEMVPQLVTQLSEFSLPLVLQAELERLLCNSVVQPLHTRISSRNEIVLSCDIKGIMVQTFYSVIK